MTNEKVDITNMKSMSSDFEREPTDEDHDRALRQLNEAFENLDPEKTAWLEGRMKAAKHIDPETAEVFWKHAYTLDPYGIVDCPEELRQIGREYFARAPDSDIWVSFLDLPIETLNALHLRLERGDFDNDDWILN